MLIQWYYRCRKFLLLHICYVVYINSKLNQDWVDSIINTYKFFISLSTAIPVVRLEATNEPTSLSIVKYFHASNFSNHYFVLFKVDNDMSQSLC